MGTVLGVSLVLWGTHLCVAAVTGSVVYWVMSRKENDVPRSSTAKSGIALIVLSAALIILGFQVRSAQHDADERRTQQACLNKFSVDVSKYFADTLNTRVAANAKLDKAQTILTAAVAAQTKANTAALLDVAGLLVDHPPTKKPVDFVHDLEAFRDATVRANAATSAYMRAQREAKKELGTTGTPAKPYDPPKVDCVR